MTEKLSENDGLIKSLPTSPQRSSQFMLAGLPTTLLQPVIVGTKLNLLLSGNNCGAVKFRADRVKPAIIPVEGTKPSESCRIPKLNSFTILEFAICTQFADHPLSLYK